MSSSESSQTSAGHRISAEEIARVIALETKAKDARDQFDKEEILAVNRKLVEAFFPDHVRSRSDVQRRSVIGYDQRHRLVCFAAASLVFIMTSVLVNPNVPSLHSFYRDRLSWAFLRFHGDSEAANQPLSKYQTQEKGAPLLLLGAAVSSFSPLSHPPQLETPSIASPYLPTIAVPRN